MDWDLVIEGGRVVDGRFVMGADSSERGADAREIRPVQERVRQAMREGAMGFSTSQLDVDVGDAGRREGETG